MNPLPLSHDDDDTPRLVHSYFPFFSSLICPIMNKRTDEQTLYRDSHIFTSRALPPPTQMEDHYTAVVLKNSSQSLQRGRPMSPRKKGGRGKSPRKRDSSSKGSRKGGSKSKSKSPSKGRKKKGKKGIRKGGGAGKQRGGIAGEPSTATKKVYASAGAFMAEHFPPEERQVRDRAVRGKSWGECQSSACYLGLNEAG